jgi:hypothetical protein
MAVSPMPMSRGTSPELTRIFFWSETAETRRRRREVTSSWSRAKVTVLIYSIAQAINKSIKIN